MDTPVPADVFRFEAFSFDRRAGALFRRDEGGALVPVTIGPRALAVLDTLVARQGDLVSKEEIMHAVWPETVVEDNNLTVQISALRRVLDQGRAGSSCIQTIAGRGYRFLGRLARDGEDPRPRLSIVVLPLANLSNDPEQQYFADGITEDLTTDLSRLAGMLVISRNTAFTYQGKRVDTKQIGRELGVRYVLEGSVRRSGNQVRVNVQLIDAESGAHVWADRFDTDCANLAEAQDEIIARLARSLSLELVKDVGGRIERERMADPNALDLVMLGVPCSQSRSLPQPTRRPCEFSSRHWRSTRDRSMRSLASEPSWVAK